MNRNNVTYTSHSNSNDPNYNHSYSRSLSQGRRTPKANTSNISYSPQTNLATMAGTPSHHAYTPSLATGMNVGVVGGPSSTLQRSATRNSYLSYASTPSWVNPSTMIETSTPATRTSRPLPDPQQYSRYMSQQPGQQGDYGSYAGQGYGYGHQQGRPTSGGFFITNVTEEEEEEVEGGEGGEEDGYVDVHPPTHPQPHHQYNIRPQNGYNNVPNNGYSMPIGMMDGKGVPMERVAPPGQYHRRPLPVPGVQQPLGRKRTIDSLKWKKKKDKTSSPPSPSLTGSLFAGLKRLPKKVLRYGRKKPMMMEEGDEEFGNLRNFDDMLPGYASQPVTPTGLGGNINTSPIAAEHENRMPGEMPTTPPTQQRFRNPSLKLTRPSGETLRQGLNTEDQEFFDHTIDHPDVHDVHENQPPPPAVEYSAPSTERGRTTVMMYHENEEGSTAPPADRSASALSQRGSSVRVGTSIPTPAIDTSVSPPANRSPETAHPPPANDYMKMTASPRTAGTQVTEYTSFSTDPSFASDLNPIFRFFAGFYHLPWFSERSTVDYSPLTGFGGKNGGRGGIGKKASQSWYKKKGDTAGLSASLSLDLLSSGEGDRDGDDRGSVISPLGGWRRGVRRNADDRVGVGGGRHGHYIRPRNTRHGRGHGHGHGHGHGQRHGGAADNGRVRGRRYRRKSTSTITFEEYHHQRNISPMIPSTYPYPFISPPFPYFAYPPPVAPTQVDANIIPNQGTPVYMGGGEEGTRKGENSQQDGQTGPRGPRNNTGHGHQGRGGAGGPVFAPGYAASPPVFPTPVWYGDAVDQRRVVYMPMSVPLPV